MEAITTPGLRFRVGFRIFAMPEGDPQLVDESAIALGDRPLPICLRGPGVVEPSTGTGPNR